jgi:hypothetical protein
MIKSPIYSVIKRVSKTLEFQQIHYILSPGYGAEFDEMSIVDQFMSMNLDDVYTIFARCYQSLSYVWLALGLRPGIYQDMSYGHIMKNMNTMPTDIIHLISSFIPENNYQDISISKMRNIIKFKFIVFDPMPTGHTNYTKPYNRCAKYQYPPYT